MQQVHCRYISIPTIPLPTFHVPPSHPMLEPTVTQCWVMASTTTLNSMGCRRSPWVPPQYPLNGSPKYPPALATMVRRSHYVRRSCIVLGPTMYAARISSHLFQSRSSYAFWRSKKTSKRTASLVTISCCSSLVSRAEKLSTAQSYFKIICSRCDTIF